MSLLRWKNRQNEKEKKKKEKLLLLLWWRWWWWRFFFSGGDSSARSLAWWIPWKGNSWRGREDTTSCVIAFLVRPRPFNGWAFPWAPTHYYFISQLFLFFPPVFFIPMSVAAARRRIIHCHFWTEENKNGIDRMKKNKKKGPTDHLLVFLTRLN